MPVSTSLSGTTAFRRGCESDRLLFSADHSTYNRIMAENERDNGSAARSSLTGLAKDFGHLPSAKRRVALEMCASLAGVSLRVSREFASAVPKAARILKADDLRNWAELGRRLAMGNVEAAARFFTAGAETLSDVPSEARTFIFEICKRQLILSSSIAL